MVNMPTNDIDLPRRKFIFPPWIFRGHVSFREGPSNFSDELSVPLAHYSKHQREKTQTKTFCLGSVQCPGTVDGNQKSGDHHLGCIKPGVNGGRCSISTGAVNFFHQE